MDDTRKGRSYFKLLDALQEPGCPLCGLVVRDGLSYLDSMMYERIMDVPTRMELMDSFGLCSWHTWQLSRLPQISSPDLGYAILASDLLGKFHRLAATVPGRSGRRLKGVFGKKRGGIGSRIKRQSCPACAHVARFESYHMRQLLDQFLDEEVSKRYGASQGICLPHFFMAEGEFSAHPNFNKLRESQAAMAKALRDTLERYIDKHDYRKREKFTPAEAKAGRAAMEFLCGKPGAFSREVPQAPLKSHCQRGAK